MGMPATLTTPLSPRARRGPTVETALYLGILLLALLTRLMMLDSQAMHHDEGIHALFGWNIYRGSGYTHDAVYHGPFIYHAGALVFSLFGDSDVTARLMPALLSIATVMLPVLLRRQLGRWGALVASFLLLISPSFLYFGRFVRNDVFAAFWTLLLFVCLVRYVQERKAGWLYGAAVTLSFYFSTKETAYITVAILGLFLAGRALWERYGGHAFWPLLGFVPPVLEDLVGALRDQPASLNQIALGPLSLSPLSLAFLGLAVLSSGGMLFWRWLEAVRQRDASPTLDLTLLLGTLVLPLLSAIPLNALLSLQEITLDYHSPNIPPEAVFWAVVAILLTFALSATLGLLWDRRRWAVAAGLFWAIFFLLHTSFFSSMTGWATGLVQSLGFWLSQQGVKRIHIGPQYYLVLMPVYETVSFLLGTVGAVFFGWRGLVKARRQQGASSPAGPPLGAAPGVATGLLAWWAPVGLAVYSLAGEQVPWLNVHPTLPFLLLAAALVGRALAYRPTPAGRASGWAERLGDLVPLAGAAGLLLWAGRPLYGSLTGAMAWLTSVVLLLGAAAAALLALRPERRGEAGLLLLGGVALGTAAILAGTLSFQGQYEEWRQIYLPLGLLLAVLVARALLVGKRALRSGLLLLFASLCAYSLSSAWRAAYIYNDTPVELLVYVQTSSDVQWVVDELEALSVLTTGGQDMAFLYDSEVAWPMEWYIRHYEQKVYQPTIAGPPAEDVGAAIVFRDKDNTSGPYLERERRFQPTRYYSFNWWFPEDTIRSAAGFVGKVAPEMVQPDPPAGWRQVLAALASPYGQARVWRYLLFREVLAPIGAREFAFYVRRDLVLPLEWLSDTIPRR